MPVDVNGKTRSGVTRAATGQRVRSRCRRHPIKWNPSHPDPGRTFGVRETPGGPARLRQCVPGATGSATDHLRACVTVLAPAFLLTLLALPVLVLLGLLNKRPRRLVVASTEIWAEVARKLESTAASPRPTVDRRMLLAMLTVLLLALGAAGLAVSRTEQVPRDVCVVIDRSGLAGEPARDDPSRSALAAALQWATAFAARLDATDRLEVRFSPPSVSGPFSTGTPDDVMASVRAAGVAVVETDGRSFSADALTALAALPASGDHADRRLVLISPRANLPSVGSHLLAAVAIPVVPRVRFESVGMTDRDLLIQLTQTDDAPDSPCRVTVVVCDPAGEPIPGWSSETSVPAPPAGETRRYLLPLPPAPGDGEQLPPAVRIEVANALPPVRAVTRRRVRVLLHAASAGLSPTDPPVVPLRGMLSAVCPAIEWTDHAPVDLVVMLAAQNDEPPVPLPMSPSELRDVPVLALGPLPEGAWPLASAVPPGAEIGRDRLALDPLHPLLIGVPLADLPLDGEWWPVRAGEGARVTAVVQDGHETGLINVVTRGSARGVFLPGRVPVDQWATRGGIPAAILLGNAVAWLLDDPALLGDTTDPAALWRAGTVEAPDLPPSAMRALEAGTARFSARTFDNDPNSQTVRPVGGLPGASGWLMIDEVTAMPINSAARYPQGGAGTPVTPESTAQLLPQRGSVRYSDTSHIVLSAALAMLLAFGMVALRRRA